jgi:hypothetical protein
MDWTLENFKQKTEGKKNQIKESNISQEDIAKIRKAKYILEEVCQKTKNARLIEDLCELNSWLIYSRK